MTNRNRPHQTDEQSQEFILKPYTFTLSISTNFGKQISLISDNNHSEILFKESLDNYKFQYLNM